MTPGFPLLLPVAGLLVATCWLDQALQCVAVLATVILLGVPHGALDGEIARPLLRPRFGWAWFPVFAVPYLGLVAGVLALWRIAPVATLAGFLAASVWHFGSEDTGPRRLEAVVRGGLPVALPVLLHPGATAALLGTVAMSPMPWPPAWLWLAAGLWCVAASWWVAQAIWLNRGSALLEPGLLALAFVALPPLTAFAIYFVCFHAPRHMAGLATDPRAPRVASMPQAITRAVPITALTIAIGAALWPWFPGDPPERLLTLTLEGLAALTLPHMLLDALTAAMSVTPVSPASTPTAGGVAADPASTGSESRSRCGRSPPSPSPPATPGRTPRAPPPAPGRAAATRG